MSQNNASNSIYKKYCSVFQQDTSIPASQEISEKYKEIKQNNENNILNSSRIASKENKSSSVNNVNLKTVIDKIVDSITRMESSNSGIQNEKSSVIVNSNTKEFISFNHFNDDTFEDDDCSLETNIIDEVKAESQWGCDTQFAALVDKEFAILSLINSKDLTQEIIEPSNNISNTITSQSRDENINSIKDVIDVNQKYNTNSHTENNNSLVLKVVEETELALSSTVLSDFNSPFCQATHLSNSQNELDVISNNDFRNDMQNIRIFEQNHNTSQSGDEVIDCPKDVIDMNQKYNTKSHTENISLILNNVEERELDLSSRVLSDFNLPFCESTQLSSSQNELNVISNNEMQNMHTAEQNHDTFLKDVTESPSQEVTFKVPNPVCKSPRWKHRYVDTSFADNSSNSMFKSDHVDSSFNALQTVSNIMVNTSNKASHEAKRAFESVDSDDNANNLQTNDHFESLKIDNESPHDEKANDVNDSLIISNSVMDTQDFSVKDLDFIFNQEMKTINGNCNGLFPECSSKVFSDFSTAGKKPLMVSNVALSNAKKLFVGIDNNNDNIQTFDTSYCIDEKRLVVNNSVGVVINDNSVTETDEINGTSSENALSQKEQPTKCVRNSSSQKHADQTEYDIARTINVTYTVESDSTDINNVSIPNINGSTGTVLADNIDQISVGLEHWEEFFNCTIVSVNNGSETSVDLDKDDSLNCALGISEEDKDDSNASLSPIIVSQRSRIKNGQRSKDFAEKPDTKDERNYNLDSCDGSVEMSDINKIMAVKQKLVSSTRKLDLLEVDSGAKDEVAQKNALEKNHLAGEECLDRIQEDFTSSSVLENFSKSCGGFVFASKKRIDISDTTLKKMKSFFDGVDKDVNELFKCDNNEEIIYEGISTASCKTGSVILTQRPFNVFEIADENKIIFSKNSDTKDMNVGSTSNIVELRAARENAIAVSEKAASKDVDKDVMTILEDTDKNVMTMVNHMDNDVMTMVEHVDKDVLTVVEDINKGVKSVVEEIEKDALAISTNTDKNAKTLLLDIDAFSEMIPEELIELGNSLESTALSMCNEPITISEKAPTKVNRRVLGLEETENELTEQNQTQCYIKATGNNNNLYDKELLKMDFFDKQDLNFGGFSLASRKPVKITKRALDFARNMFKDFEQDEVIVTNVVRKELLERSDSFRSNGLEKSSSSNDTNQIFKHLDEDGQDFIENFEDDMRNVEPDQFSKPSTVPIALEKGSTPPFPKFSGLSGASSKVKPVLGTALAKVRDAFKDETGNIAESTVPYPKFSGFNTAGEKPIHISEKALAKVRDGVFKDFNLESVNIEEPTVSYRKFSGFNTAGEKPIHISEKALAKVRDGVFKDFNLESVNIEEPTVSYPKFSVFNTAGEKPIHISEKALAKVRDGVFKDFNLESVNIEEPTVSYPKFPVFNNAGEKPIHISEKALAKVRDGAFKDCNLESVNIVEEPTVSYPKFSVFNTAGEKPIHISEKALAKVRDGAFKAFNLESVNIVEEPTVSYPKFSGFNTAGEKPIHISEKALAKVRDGVFKDFNLESVNMEEPTVSYPKFSGFNTASEKSIHISEKALAKVRDGVFKDLDLETVNIEESTKVVVPEQAFSKAKMLFAEDFNNGITSEQKENKYLTVSKDGGILNSNNNIKTVSDFKEVTDFEMLIPIKPKVSKEECDSKNVIDGYTSNSVPKTYKRKRPVSPDHIDNPSDFLVENLTQEISESALALMNDEKENFSSNFEKANCSSNIDKDEAPLSPILPCRWKNRAKKIFKAPYKSQVTNEDNANSHVLKKGKFTDKIDVLEIKSKVCSTDESVNDFIKNKNIDLEDLLNSKLRRGDNKITLSSITAVNSEVSEDVLSISPDNFDHFVFSNERLDIKNGVNTKESTVKDLVSLFFEHKDVDSKLIPDGWILNGIKWIIWKLASYERFYGGMFQNTLSASAVLTQLKYRYDKELYKAERPILRKILEMDDAPGRKMILCVSRIIELPVVISDTTNAAGKVPPAFELEVTDGWYGVLATIDNVLCSYILKKKLQVGTKLIVCGSELLNCGQGKTPLEDISAVRLRLHSNGVRRAHCSARLGPCSDGRPLRMAVDTLEQGAGPTPTLRIRPIVVYPLQHYEKLPNGSTVTRSDRMEMLESSRQQSALQARAERLYAQAEEEVLREAHLEHSEGRKSTRRGGPADSQDSEEDLIQQMDLANDPVEFLNNLSRSQRKNLETAISERNENIRQQIESRVSELMNGDGDSSSSRRVVSMLKVRALVLETVGGHHQVVPVMLTVWKPSDCTEQMLQVKDIVLDTYKAVPTGMKAGEINLSANKTTVFREVSNKKLVDKFTEQMEKYRRKCTSIQDTNHPSFAPLFKEVDTVGLIFHLEPSVMDNAKQYVQTVYLADQDMNFVAINFWGGIHKFGFEKCIEIGKILACCNLKYRTASRKRIRNLYASEFSTFTQCPKKAYMQEFLNEFEHSMKPLNFKEYTGKCRNHLNNMNNSLNTSNISRLQNVSSTSKSGIVFDRSHNSTNGQSKMNLNENSLSGLDFDSTFTENSSVSKSPLDAERRIKRLKMYGEPPPLAALVLNVSSNIKKDFIAPSIDTSLRKEICNENDTNNKNNEDHFREEFEYSPPLSLD